MRLYVPHTFLSRKLITQGKNCSKGNATLSNDTLFAVRKGADQMLKIIWNDKETCEFPHIFT